MPDARTIRRLAAILAADVVGYSRLMAADEAGTLAALKRHRQMLFDPAVAGHSGRVVKLIGDGTLVEFASVVDAVNCALAVQRDAATAQDSGPQITLRIGINLGDVIVEGDDIYGDGVNVAARLEPLAEPGGVCVASIVNESVGSRIDVRFNDGGEVHVKNIDRPIRVWKWHPASSAAPADASAQAAAPAPPKVARQAPSIAVLPFANMSGDAEQEYFSDGLSEDIITDLSKIGGLAVIARNSSFAYKGKNVDIRAIGRELGVGAVLEGSIRRAGNRVRITAQLIDAGTGNHLWAERYDRELTDIFAVQDEVTRHIVTALKVTLTPGEAARIAGAGTSNTQAHDYFLRGRALLLNATKNRERFLQIETLFKQAIAIDPGYAEPYAGLAMAYNHDFQNRWTEQADTALVRAKEYVDKAVALGPDLVFAHYVAGVVYNYLREPERAAAEADKAVELGPNDALALNARGSLMIYRGEAARAIPEIERAMALDPAFGQQYLHFLGLAHLLIRKFENAAAMFRQRITLVPDTDISRSMLAVTLGHLGEVDEARRVWADLKRVNPKYSFEGHLARQPFRNPADAALIREGAAKAGLPD